MVMVVMVARVEMRAAMMGVALPVAQAGGLAGAG